MLKFSQIKLPKFNKKSAIIAASIVLVLLFVIAIFRSMPSKITLLEYDNFLQAGAIQNAIIDGDSVIIKALNRSYIIPKEMISLNELGQRVAVESSGDGGLIWVILILMLLAGVVFVVIKFAPFIKVAKKPQEKSEPANLLEGVSNHITPAVSDISFNDVAGIKDVKSELIEIVDFLKNPTKYSNLGIKPE